MAKHMHEQITCTFFGGGTGERKNCTGNRADSCTKEGQTHAFTVGIFEQYWGSGGEGGCAGIETTAAVIVVMSYPLCCPNDTQ